MRHPASASPRLSQSSVPARFGAETRYVRYSPDGACSVTFASLRRLHGAGKALSCKVRRQPHLLFLAPCLFFVKSLTRWVATARARRAAAGADLSPLRASSLRPPPAGQLRHGSRRARSSAPTCCPEARDGWSVGGRMSVSRPSQAHAPHLPPRHSPALPEEVALEIDEQERVLALGSRIGHGLIIVQEDTLRTWRRTRRRDDRTPPRCGRRSKVGTAA
jgi:hypothetical protein